MHYALFFVTLFVLWSAFFRALICDQLKLSAAKAHAAHRLGAFLVVCRHKMVSFCQIIFLQTT